MVTYVWLPWLQRKMDSREYKTPSDFAEDVRLIFTNCYRYNPPESDVVMMAKKLQDVFEMKYARMPDDLSSNVDDGEYSKDGGSDSSATSEVESSDNESEQERERETRLNDLREQVRCPHGVEQLLVAIN